MATYRLKKGAKGVVAANSFKRLSLVKRLIQTRAESTYHDRKHKYHPAESTRELVTTSAIEAEFKKFDAEFRNLKQGCSSDNEDDQRDQETNEVYTGSDLSDEAEGEEDENEGHLIFCEKAASCDQIARKDLACWIASKAYKTFATAVISGFTALNLLPFMLMLREEKFTDQDLESIKLHDAILHFEWDPASAARFGDSRWDFLVPVFSPEQYNYNLSSECLFPFQKDDAFTRKGAFGLVTKVEVHKEHLKHPNMKYVAVKEIELQSKDKSATNTAWEDEARALQKINSFNHSHITKCIAAIRRGDRRYFMFPWAEGGNLQELWEQTPRQTPKASLILQMLIQLRGLVDALQTLHTCNIESKNTLTVPGQDTSNESIRHGDLKPENILRFLSHEKISLEDNAQHLGTLKIADMGLAKQHIVATALRKNNTSQRFGTIRYEAPEALKEGGRSRLYDIWSMGCITLEFIIWILYGNDALEEFHSQVAGEKKQACQYFENGDENTIEVHHVVAGWMDHIRQNDPECSNKSALRDVLDLVRDRLLVVALDPSPRRDSLTSRIGHHLKFRADAEEFRASLDMILSQTSTASYLFTEQSRYGIKWPDMKARAAHAQAQRGLPQHGEHSKNLGMRSYRQTLHTEYSVPPLKDWEYPVDNAFAEQLKTIVGSEAFCPQNNRRAKLCQQCIGLDFWIGGFSLEVTYADLADRAANCDLCSMLTRACSSYQGEPYTGNRVQLNRIQSNLKLANVELPVLSIIKSPEAAIPTPIQLGFPALPRPKSALFYHILKLWLQECDDAHISCASKSSAPDEDTSFVPTRLIDVGTGNDVQLRLIETLEEKNISTRYIALSHPWGDTIKYPPFSTLRTDDSGMGHDLVTLMKSIHYNDLPETFKDAVDCTRALGIRYLWIDSICILQGPDGDFNEQAQKMEKVFSRAYCVLAASRAKHQHDGFLKDRQQRKFLTIQRGEEQPFYICEPIDDFSRDVIEGSLNQRGWVLQERALARRTIYFAEHQTYFECGRGIRCETLSCMHNNMADFVGDSNFPEKAMRSHRGLRLEYCQDLYKLYSRLQFSGYEDRPFAIAGLERRLIQVFNTKGGYGIFDDGDKLQRGLFHRSILWRHGDESEFCNGLEPIDFSGRGIHVPSWSWMAYKGGIDYTTPEGGTAEWETNDIYEPWTRSQEMSVTSDGMVAILAVVRNFHVANRLPDEVKLYYDTGRTKGSDGQRAQCVLVAREKKGMRRHYVLLVGAQNADSDCGRKIYKRLGAGFMLGKHIDLEEPGIKAKIQ